jgi:uncharacterized small protein (DUF1192 family)
MSVARIFAAALLASAAVLPGLAPAGAVTPVRASSIEHIDVAFVLDTTGSMADLIDGAKAKIFAIADEIRRKHPNAELRIGLIGYRDIGDAYVTDIMDLDADIHAVYGRLVGFQASGGGDWPESVNEALNASVARLSWNESDTTRRLVFLVGDAPPHMDYEQDVPFTDTLEIAEREGIIVNAVQAGASPDTEAIWRSIASLGNGEYIAIPQSGGVQVVQTPFDQQIYDLQIRINGTVVPYGSSAERQVTEETLGQIAAAPAPVASDMASYSTRGAASESGTYEVVSGGGDLIAEVIAGRVAPADVADDAWPEDWQGLSADERVARIDSLVEERSRLQAELGGLVASRDAAIAEAEAGAGGDSFDLAVEGVLGRQLQ